MKERFLEIFREKVTRKGADKLIEWLESQDMFTAPASTKYHLCREGGLCEHSIHVYERLRKLMQAEMTENGELTPEQEETAAIVGLLHDVCKVGFYTQEMRNKKDENGRWVQVPVYAIDDKCPYGHGEKSVFIVSKFIPLRTEESFAIRFHMAAWQDGEKNNAGRAFEMYKLALLAHLADMEATYLDEVE